MVIRTGSPARRGPLWVLIVAVGMLAAVIVAPPASAAWPASAPAAITTAPTTAAAAKTAAAGCQGGLSGDAIPTMSSGRSAVRTTIGIAKSMGVGINGQIIAVMVMYQESSIRNLANDGTSAQTASWPYPGRAYWLNVAKLSLNYPHDKFGFLEGAHDTDSIGLYQQRPAYGWGNYGSSTGITDPSGVVQRLLDPRWEAMAFFGGPRSAAPTTGLLDIPGWQAMALTDAANAVQKSNYPGYYAQWEVPATNFVNANQDVPPIAVPWCGGDGQPPSISLRARANNRYVTAENGGSSPLIANRTTVGLWERFDAIELGNGTIALRARANNAYVCADNSGSSSLIANRGAVGAWETYTLVNNSDGTVSLWSWANGKYVTAENGGKAPLIANRSAIGPWEKFDLIGS